MMFKQESKSSSQTPESSGLDQKEPDGPHSHEKKESEAILHGQWHQLLNTQDYVLKFSINELRLIISIPGTRDQGKYLKLTIEMKL